MKVIGSIPIKPILLIILKLKSNFKYNSNFYSLNNSSKSIFYKLIDVNLFYIGIFSFQEAFKRAINLKLDLIEISKFGLFSICRIIKYGKYQYSLIKKNIKKKSLKSKHHLKEMNFKIFIYKKDYYDKINKIIRFFNNGCKVKISFYFRGREIYKKDNIKFLVNSIISDLSEYSYLENKPNINDKQFFLFFKSKKIKYDI